MPAVNKELHRTGRIGWQRGTVLGANDGKRQPGNGRRLTENLQLRTGLVGNR